MNQLCNNAVLPLLQVGSGTPEQNLGTGISMFPYPDNGYSGAASRGRIAWIDPDACPVCGAMAGWTLGGFVHPLYKDYHVEVYEDGVLKFDEPHWTVHGVFNDNIQYPDQLLKGDFHYLFPITAGHVYTARVGKNGNDGITVWSAVMSFTTVAVAPVVPPTVQVTSGQRTSKKK